MKAIKIDSVQYIELTIGKSKIKLTANYIKHINSSNNHTYSSNYLLDTLKLINIFYLFEIAKNPNKHLSITIS